MCLLISNPSYSGQCGFGYPLPLARCGLAREGSVTQGPLWRVFASRALLAGYAARARHGQPPRQGAT